MGGCGWNGALRPSQAIIGVSSWISSASQTDQAKLQPDITKAAEYLLGRLRLGGALRVDQLTGAAGQLLDVNDPDQRNKAVRATIQASTGLLGPGELDRSLSWRSSPKTRLSDRPAQEAVARH